MILILLDNSMRLVTFELPDILRALLDLVEPLRVGDFPPVELMQRHYRERFVGVPDHPQVVLEEGTHQAHIVQVVELQID